jgi:hypothetical protein
MEKELKDVPEGVTDREAYDEWLKLSKHPILTTKRVVELSDGEVVNLASFPHIIQKRIQHLPVKEQTSVMAKKDLYYKINNKATALKRAAFGLKQGRQEKGSGLLDSKREEMLEYFGRMFTVDEVLKIVNTEWGIPMNKQSVMNFRKEYASEIESRVEKFKASYSDIRLGVKRSRLEELVWLYSKQKEKYENSRSREDYKLLLVTLEQIRKEAEGDRLTIDGKIDVNYEATIHAHLRDEVFKSMNLKEIILGRVSARMNVNPVKLIFSLNQSFYAKFSNVLGTYDDESQGELIYPSQMNYNFEKIQKYQEQRDQEVQDAVIVEESSDKKDEAKATDAKAKMIEKLKMKREAMKETKANINAETEIKGKNKRK